MAVPISRWSNYMTGAQDGPSPTALVEHIDMIVLWGADPIVMKPDHICHPPSRCTAHWNAAVGGRTLTIRATPQEHINPPRVTWDAYIGVCDAQRNAIGDTAQEAVDSLRVLLVVFMLELAHVLREGR